MPSTLGLLISLVGLTPSNWSWMIKDQSLCHRSTENKLLIMRVTQSPSRNHLHQIIHPTMYSRWVIYVYKAYLYQIHGQLEHDLLQCYCCLTIDQKPCKFTQLEIHNETIIARTNWVIYIYVHYEMADFIWYVSIVNYIRLRTLTNQY